MAKHALLSASSSHRWLNCPPSARFSEGVASTSSPYALEGTRAHELAEYALKGLEPESLTKEERLEMWPLAQDYGDYVRDIAGEYGAVSVEQRLDFSYWVPEGFGTADAVVVVGKELHVIDYKYGKGVEVSAIKNPQGLLYALGAYELVRSIYEDLEQVTVHIYQPRLSNISTYTLGVQELLEFGEYVRPIAARAFEGSGEFKEGEHCKFCPKKGECLARASAMLKVPATSTELSTLTVADLGELLPKLDRFEKWAKDVKAYALEQALQGQTPSGYKLVEGRTRRSYADQTAIAERLESAGYEAAIIHKPRELVGLTELEKTIGKKKLAELVGDLIVKPAGAPTLAPASDKRAPIVLDPFKHIEEAKRAQEEE